MLAARGGHTDIVVELVKAGAKLDLQNDVCKLALLMVQDVFCITQDGDSAVMLAARGGHTGVVVELVEAKANYYLQNNVRSTPTITRYCST